MDLEYSTGLTSPLEYVPSDPASAREFWDDLQSRLYDRDVSYPCHDRGYESEVFDSSIPTSASELFSSRTSDAADIGRRVRGL